MRLIFEGACHLRTSGHTLLQLCEVPEFIDPKSGIIVTKSHIPSAKVFSVSDPKFDDAANLLSDMQISSMSLVIALFYQEVVDARVCSMGKHVAEVCNHKILL